MRLAPCGGPESATRRDSPQFFLPFARWCAWRPVAPLGAPCRPHRGAFGLCGGGSDFAFPESDCAAGRVPSLRCAPDRTGAHGVRGPEADGEGRRAAGEPRGGDHECGTQLPDDARGGPVSGAVVAHTRPLRAFQGHRARARTTVLAVGQDAASAAAQEGTTGNISLGSTNAAVHRYATLKGRQIRTSIHVDADRYTGYAPGGAAFSPSSPGSASARARTDGRSAPRARSASPRRRRPRTPRS